jgi:hypothetical protein
MTSSRCRSSGHQPGGAFIALIGSEFCAARDNLFSRKGFVITVKTAITCWIKAHNFAHWLAQKSKLPVLGGVT